MKLAIFLAITSFPTFAQYHFDKGEKITVTEHRWMRMPQSEASCQLIPLSQLTVENVTSELITVSYSVKKAQRNGECINGTTLEFFPHHLDTLRNDSFVYQAKKEKINSLLKGESIDSYQGYALHEKLGINSWTWISLENNIGKFSEMDLCRIVAGGEVLIEGFWPEKKLALLRYLGNESDYQECPNGSLFFDQLP